MDVAMQQLALSLLREILGSSTRTESEYPEDLHDIIK
jgi:hypothetical protein